LPEAVRSALYLLYFATVASPAIPNRPLFRAQEVCELADVQAYVLRSWEAEFPDLGVAKTSTGPRVYRRADVERVLRIKQLVFVDGLTLAGARRRLSEETPAATATDPGSVSDSEFADLLNETTRQELLNVRRGLSWILGVLSGNGVAPEDFVLRAPSGRNEGASGAAEPRRAAARAASTVRPKAARGKSAKSKPARRAVGGRKR
jgi:DNA-binding transcriptional MerR regulator